jgi:hypothetical protein
LVAGRYGDRGPSGFSPTEDEFNEAQRLHKPTIVLVQETVRDSDQEDFLQRLRGGWEQGLLYDSGRLVLEARRVFADAGRVS